MSSSNVGCGAHDGSPLLSGSGSGASVATRLGGSGRAASVRGASVRGASVRGALVDDPCIDNPAASGEPSGRSRNVEITIVPSLSWITSGTEN